MNLIELGSQTARNGFKNEQDVVNIFNDWENSKLAQDWLKAMNYKIKDIEFVHAEKIKGQFKGDIQVQIKITVKLKRLLDCQNISVKLVSNKKGFNQIDKRWLKNYQELWNMPKNVFKIFQYFTGEKLPYKPNTKDTRRMFLTEMTKNEQNTLLNWVKENKYLIAGDILKGRGKFSAEWMLVIQKIETPLKWVLKPMNELINFYLQEDVDLSPRGSIKLGKITIQRKGGDGGRETAKMLQFKIDPTELFNF